jgi:hypothetical protein
MQRFGTGGNNPTWNLQIFASLIACQHEPRFWEHGALQCLSWRGDEATAALVPLKDRRKVEGFIKSAQQCCLKRATSVRTREFARRPRKCIFAHHQIGENSLDGAPAAASRDQIDAIVKKHCAAPSSTTSKWKWKNTRRPQLIEQWNDQEPR